MRSRPEIRDTAHGAKAVVSPCTATPTERLSGLAGPLHCRSSREVSIDLVATSALQRGTGRTVARPPDSPVTIIRIYKTEVRDAAGGVTVDGTSADATWANLYRQRLDIYGP